jgi:hypothetical protein
MKMCLLSAESKKSGEVKPRGRAAANEQSSRTTAMKGLSMTWEKKWGVQLGSLLMQRRCDIKNNSKDATSGEFEVPDA